MNDIDAFIARYGLRDSHVYLLELIPLIEMIWADGKNQQAEISLLYRHTLHFLSDLSRKAEHLQVISAEDVEDFMARFTARRPDPEMLRELRQMALERLSSQTDRHDAQNRLEQIRDTCLEIAAACADRCPDRFDRRIVDSERQLLTELFDELGTLRAA